MLQLGLDESTARERTGLGHAPALQHARAVAGEAADQRFRHSRAADDHAHAWRQAIALGVGIEQLQDRDPDRRHAERVRGLFEHEQVDEIGRAEMRTGKDQLDAHHRRAVRNAPAVGVEHRRHRQDAVLGGEIPVIGLVRDQRVQHHRAVRVHDAFRPAGRAGRVAHRDRIILVVPGILETLRCGGEEFLVIDVRRGNRRAGERHDDDLLEPHLITELCEQRQQAIVDDEKAILGVMGDPRDLFRREAQVERVRHAAGGRNPEVAFEMRVVIPAERGDAVALLQSRRQQRRRQLARAPVEIGEAVAMQRLVRQAADDFGLRIDLAGALQQSVAGQRHALHRRANHATPTDSQAEA